MAAADPTLPRDNAFWQFSLAVYGAPGVATECLVLQDTLGIDVNLLLFVAWLGQKRRIALSESDIARVEGIVQPWHLQAVRPLRAIRRDLKAFPTADRELFRNRVKALEIEAEQIEQALLFSAGTRLFPADGANAPTDAAKRNMDLYLQRAAGTKKIPPIDKLVSATTASSRTRFI